MLQSPPPPLHPSAEDCPPPKEGQWLALVHQVNQVLPLSGAVTLSAPPSSTFPALPKPVLKSPHNGIA